MGVRLVIGRAGSGKTRRCFQRVAEMLRRDPLGPPVFWVVPRQATFMTERELTVAGGLGGFCRAAVVSFESLGEMVLAECGGAAVQEVTPIGRQMVLGHLLRTHAKSLRYYGASARQSGLAARLDATFAEFERCGRTSDDLGALLADLSRVVGADGRLNNGAEERTGSDDASSTPSSDERAEPESEPAVAPEVRALYDKVHDLKLLYDRHTAYLGQDRLDRHRRLRQVLECIETSARFRGAHVFVDGFVQFGEYERRVIARLGKVCASVEVMLLMDPRSPLLASPHLNPDELSLFHPVEQTYRQLRATLAEEGVGSDGPVVLTDVHRFSAPALALIERDVMKRLPIHRDEPAEAVEMIEAADRAAEVDAVARRIRELWRRGVRLREIIVLVRDLEDYHELISASFREHEIEYFADRRRPMAHHALLQFLRAALLIARHAWPHEWVMTLAKSGLAGMDDADADELENYVLEHRVRGAGAWTQEAPWLFERRLLTAEDERAAACAPARADALRRDLVTRLRPFLKTVGQDGLTFRGIVIAVYELMERFGVRDTLGRWMEDAEAQGQFEQRAEHAQVWAELVGLLDQMVDLLGDEPATLDDFVDVYEAALEQFELAIAPPTVDQVLVGQVDRVRAPAVKVAFVLGLNEGVFPRLPREDTVLSDAERRELRERRLDVDPDTHRRLLDENLLAYLALTRASERLIVSRSLVDAAGKPIGPSRYWLRLQEMLPALRDRVRQAGAEGATLAGIGTPRQLVTRLMEWARARAEGMEDGGWKTETAKGERTGAGTCSPSPHLPISPPMNPDAPDQSAPAAADEAAYPALYQWLATHPTADDAIDVMRFRAWKAVGYANRAALSDRVAERLAAGALTPAGALAASITRLETFAACPFKHFARYGLGLRRRADDEVTPIDLGNVFHQVLERLVGELVTRKAGWADIDESERQALIERFAREAGQALRGEVLLSDGRNRYLLRRVQRALAEVTAAQRAAALRGQFAPAFAELVFGPERTASAEPGAPEGAPEGAPAKLPALELLTPARRRLALIGKIDRVDLSADGTSFAVVDYKLQGAQLSLDRVYHGLSLQLLTYLLVLRERGDVLAGGRKLSPAAGLYVRLLREPADVAHPDDAEGGDDPELLALRVKPRGIVGARHLPALDAELAAGGRSRVIAAMLRADGSCGDKGRTDVAEEGELHALLEHARRKIAELADQILGGRIEIRPFNMNRYTPCAACDFRSVCRFDPAINRYHVITAMGRERILRRVVEEVKARAETGADGSIPRATANPPS